MDLPSADPVTPDPGNDRTRLNLLVDEAARQLAICNACRYCEGLCAVFPALERRSLLSLGDVSQLANLCHDCRACYDACMYTAPHEFAVNVPAALSAVRVEDYRRYVWPAHVPRALAGWLGIFSGAVIAFAVMLAIAVGNAGWAGLIARDDRAESPYVLIPYWALLTLLLIASSFAIVVGGAAARRYWVTVGGTNGRVNVGAIARAVWYSATLRYMRGGGVECYYPDDEKPSASRRRLHAVVASGFGLCIVSTTAAAVLQHIVGSQPPYPLLSVPVITGTIGGIGMLIGCGGLLWLKTQSSGVTSVAQMTVKDYGLLVALAFLALSGLATLLTRSTAAFGIVFLVHLSSVMLAFASAPYSKFMHVIFRFAALVRDSAERSS